MSDFLPFTLPGNAQCLDFLQLQLEDEAEDIVFITNLDNNDEYLCNYCKNFSSKIYEDLPVYRIVSDHMLAVHNIDPADGMMRKKRRCVNRLGYPYCQNKFYLLAASTDLNELLEKLCHSCSNSIEPLDTLALSNDSLEQQMQDISDLIFTRQEYEGPPEA